MKRTKKALMILCMSLVMTIVSFHYNFELTFANPVQTQQPEQPSLWALEDVQMLNIYNIIDPSMFQGYKSEVTKEELYTVGVKLYEKLANTTVELENQVDTYSVALQKAHLIKLFDTSLADTDFQVATTRNDIVVMLYKIMTQVEPTFDYNVDLTLAFEDALSIPAESLEAVKYTVSNNLLKGSNNQLSLLDTCTKEQLLALVSRTYDYVIQKADRAAKGAFWEVSGGTSTVYLLGSIHMADSSIYPMNDDILNAFNESDSLAVEANILTDTEGIAYMQQLMFFADGTTIDQVISEEIYKAYASKMDSYGVPKAQYDLFKPWSAALTIQNIEAAKSSITATLGVDVFFMSKSLYSKPILEIEGIKFQADLFDSFSAELQEGFLQGILATPDETEEGSIAESTADSIFKMLEAWKLGDMTILDEMLAFDESSTDEFSKKFWIDRNNHMFDKILTYLNDESEKTYFVIVGAGHMVSNTGMVKQLQDKGYTVTQIK